MLAGRENCRVVKCGQGVAENKRNGIYRVNVFCNSLADTQTHLGVLMATINQIAKAKVNSIEPVAPHVYRRGNGRRLRALLQGNDLPTIPETAQIADVAEFQIDCEWGRGEVYTNPTAPYWRQASGWTPCPTNTIVRVHSMLFLGSSKGIDRPSGSKILLTPQAKEAYAILGWPDLFGYGVKECQLGQKNGTLKWLVYANKLDDLSEIHEALYTARVNY